MKSGVAPRLATATFLPCRWSSPRSVAVDQILGGRRNTGSWRQGLVRLGWLVGRAGFDEADVATVGLAPTSIRPARSKGLHIPLACVPGRRPAEPTRPTAVRTVALTTRRSAPDFLRRYANVRAPTASGCPTMRTERPVGLRRPIESPGRPPQLDSLRELELDHAKIPAVLSARLRELTRRSGAGRTIAIPNLMPAGVDFVHTGLSDTR
jgi:hypothetical protein